MIGSSLRFGPSMPDTMFEHPRRQHQCAVQLLLWLREVVLDLLSVNLSDGLDYVRNLSREAPSSAIHGHFWR